MSTVLLSEDCSPTRQWIANLLRRNGLRAIETSDGIEAWQQIQENRPDLAIADIAMPTLKNYDLCNRLKSDPETRYIPFIYYSSLRGEFDPGWKRKQRADAYIKKYDLPKLLEAVKQLLGLNGESFPNINLADAWTEYGILLADSFRIFERDNGRSICQNILAIFEKALEADARHASAQHYCDRLQEILRQKQQYTVLVAEDSASVREMICDLLAERDIQVIQAADGVETMEKIQENLNRIDLAIKDISSPRMNGYEVCRLMKANPQTRHIPFIFCSSKGEIWDYYWGLKQGADAYIAKPFQPQELVDTVMRLLQGDYEIYHPITPASVLTKRGIQLQKSGGEPSGYYASTLNTFDRALELKSNGYTARRERVTVLEKSMADLWTEYGIQQERLGDQNGEAWAYTAALEAFETALRINPNHSLANRHRASVRQYFAQRERSRQSQQSPCTGCLYYYGKDGLTCAVHPFGISGEHCADWKAE